MVKDRRNGLAPLVLVHEYFTGGGWPGINVPGEILAEGTAILQALLSEFRQWGKYRTVTTVDTRLVGVDLGADELVRVAPGRYWQTLQKLAAGCEAALIVAPESGGALTRISALAAGAGAQLLGSEPDAISTAADKWECYRRFQSAGLPTVPTWRVDRFTATEIAEKTGFPVVIKPVDGVGCEGVMLAEDMDSLNKIIDRQEIFRHGKFLVQEYMKGIHASVSLLAGHDRSTVLCLNRQFIQPGQPFQYWGGETPFRHPLEQAAGRLAQSAVSLIPGLCGFVGVDLLLVESGGLIVEINPRLTTSYLGLSQVSGHNLARAIWRACLDNEVYPNGTMLGIARFMRTGDAKRGFRFQIEFSDS